MPCFGGFLMQKIIIGIHGLGNHPSERILERWWKMAIHEGLKANGTRFPFLRFELAYWAHVVHPRPLDPSIKDPLHPLFLEEPYTPGGEFVRCRPPVIKRKLRNAVSKRISGVLLKKDMSLKLAGVADLVLHKYFRDLQDYFAAPGAVRNAICGALERTLRKHRRKEILLIGHSMGSIIAYDVLTRPGADWSVDTLITIGSPLGLPVVVSKLHSERKKTESEAPVLPETSFPPGSTVQLGNAEPPVLPETSFPPGSTVQLGNAEPPTLRTPPGVKRAWINLADMEDRVALDFKLADNFGINENGVGVEDRLVHNNYEYVGKRNPHKSYGYLRAPETADILYEFLTCRKHDAIRRLVRMFTGK
jgi:hypothetical protein